MRCTTMLYRTAVLTLTAITACIAIPFPALAQPWNCHVIDGTISGADGVRIADANGDGLMDVVTGFEQAGQTRVYINPGPKRVHQPWPFVTVGSTPDVEDAVFADIDSDGRPDVVSCCEGRTRRVFVHWAPGPEQDYLNAKLWQTVELPLPEHDTMWMYCLPLDLDGQHGLNLVLGGKQTDSGKGAALGIAVTPAEPRNVTEWRWIELTRVGWIMSIEALDIDRDGDVDLIYSDRYSVKENGGEPSGVYWLENPGSEKIGDPWKKHPVGAIGRQVMFIDVGDFDSTGRLQVFAAVKPNEIHHLVAPTDPRQPWQVKEVIKVTGADFEVGTSKAVRARDLNGDGRFDLAFTCEGATGQRRGVVWLEQTEKGWQVHDLSGPVGIKFDRIEFVDLDGDGDFDLLTTEESEATSTPGVAGLGVVWYENPAKGSSAAARPQPALPEGNAPQPVSFPYFGHPSHAVVWRNWGLISAEDLARVLNTTPENIRNLAQAMGLPAHPALAPDFRRRGYITLVRRNWHLLPYDQLLDLLGMTAEELAYSLREDDFLFVKLGNHKPRCERVVFQAPDETVAKQIGWIRQVVREHFGAQLAVPEEPRFAFVEELSRPRRAVPPQPSTSTQEAPRYLYSYFGPYGDPLSDPRIDPYPDGLLERLAELGVNGVWLHVVLRNLAPGEPEFPEFGAGCEVRLENLRKLVERAKRYGIGIYLYINEPRAMPWEFFRNHPEIAGVAEGQYVTMCTSHPKVRAWLTRSLQYVFSQVPNLAGVFTITASENLTNCASHGRHKDCPRCRDRSPDEIIAEVNAAIEAGVHAASPRAHVLVWDWGWHGHGDASSLIPLLPKSVWLMSVSEWAQPFERGGVAGRVGEYSLSVVGPGPRALKHWKVAQENGLKTAAKLQLGATWELSAVPFVPVLDLVAEHCSRLAQVGVDGCMLSWTVGCYPSPNLAVANRLLSDKSATPDAVLNTVAQQRYGPRAVGAARQAWRLFSTAFQEYPFHIQVVYRGPQHWGPANLLFAEQTGYRATMVGFPYDDLDGWRGPYPREVFAQQFSRVATIWADGLREFAKVVALADEDKKPIAEADYRVAQAAQIHLASVANQARFIMARNRYYSARDAADRAQAAATLDEILTAEISLAKQLYSITKCDSRIGFEASNHYYYVPLDLVEKVINCEYLRQQFRQ
ncbi:MAG TPA: VCBS repeat-containing protein [Thermogutta sp.]|nr:VCBS repeat-containing protein [Thermogutta sp.]HPU07485.1 VCBS repeat-containing protein [Thermogutta sp.]